jgi:hypothetical protein
VSGAPMIVIILSTVFCQPARLCHTVLDPLHHVVVVTGRIARERIRVP